MTLRAVLVALPFVVSACLGTEPPQPHGVMLEPPTAPGPSARDADPSASDAGSPPASDAGTSPSPDGAAADPCAAVSCGAHAHCATGQCRCDDGYAKQGGQCLASPVGEPTSHTQAEVCARFAQSATVAPGVFSVSSATCDPGQLSADGIANAVARINFHRWLVGLGPVGADASANERAQKCALISAWNPAGPQAHFPSSSAQCYTPEGAQGAGSSNIAWGANTPVGAIDQWIEDWGNASTMGHRRWILNPPLDPIGFGLYEGGDAGYGGAACLIIFNQQGTGPNPDFVAYPPPGFVPVQIAMTTWTFSSNAFDFSNPSVTVTRLSDGMNLAVTIIPLENPGGFNYPNATSFVPSGWAPEAGQTYRVTVTGGAASQTYEVKPVGC